MNVFCGLHKSKILSKYGDLSHFILRTSSQGLKKFYEKTTVSQSESGFEINLDHRKLKTPGGSAFQVPSWPLALAVASEWERQDIFIAKHTMHLNSLCNAAIDNPMQLSRSSLVESILHFLDTDTVLFWSENPAELFEEQQRKWGPLLAWAEKRFCVPIPHFLGLNVPGAGVEQKHAFATHLNSFSDWALVGIQNAVESVKSVLIVAGLIEKQFTVEQAVSLARLEHDFQTERWGAVEWHHDLDMHETSARLAAAALFVHFCSSDYTFKVKLTKHDTLHQDMLSC